MTSPSSEAIGAVSDLLSARLSHALANIPVPLGRPDAGGAQGRALNLFLYRVGFDPHLRNEPLDRGQPPPLWLVLHYLLTAFDTARALKLPKPRVLLFDTLMGKGVPFLETRDKNHFIRVDPPEWQQALAVLDQSQPYMQPEGAPA